MNQSLGPTLCAIIPAYNEEKRIAGTIEKQFEELRGYAFEIIVCDDGSTDNTSAICEASAKRLGVNLTVTKQEHAGRGQALKHALAKCSSEYVAFSSADIVLKRTEIEDALKRLRGADIVMFSKDTKHRSERTVVRWILSRSFALLVRMLFGLPFRDTQGVKIMRLHSVKEIVLNCRSSGFFFDAEVAVAASKRGLRIAEKPWQYSYSPGSKVTPGAVIKMILEMVLAMLRA